MATVVLAAAGAGIGSAAGGAVMGLTATAIGRFAGAAIGQRLDQAWAARGADPVEVGRVDRLRLTGTGEGAPISYSAGRVRTSGHIIWASQFTEEVDVTGSTSGSKGMPPQPSIHSYRYRVSLAVALGQGVVSGVSRLWADGVEIALSDLEMRLHHGTQTQDPDPTITAIEGDGNTPAYRGTAYVVFADLELAQFGNRIPQFSFEVVRTVPENGGGRSLMDLVQATAIIPATGEYALATTPVSFETDLGEMSWRNRNTPSGMSDFATSLGALTCELPRCSATSLVVSWFGNDLRCGHCEIHPKAEQNDIDSVDMPWVVSGIDRKAARIVPQVDSTSVYGGTPCDTSVKEAMTALKEAGKKVMFYPFILMDQLPGNGLFDPYCGGQDQPALPWRGRITLDRAPTMENSVDGLVQANHQVDAFFGAAQVTDFALTEMGDVVYTGPADWGYRRFILHYAMLCVAAGGVDSFCIGSEMRGLTQIRGENNGFPAVDHLITLARDVRDILGPDTKISYAADWSEYFGYISPQGDRYFHLDPLWASDDIDFIGIDNYMPLSDWRDGDGHLDRPWGTIYNTEYLKSNVQGGEGYDWYYATQKDRDVQNRRPITDGAHGEPWIWRYKDLLNWWANPHHERIGGTRQVTSTPWVPKSKPIWFTELGCAAVDKGSNQPNKFLDPKSSESSLPHYSSGMRDDAMQHAFLTALHEYWADPDHNPVSPNYGGSMIDLERMYVWAWDARPYPWFPNAKSVWSDGPNYRTGHWLNGRATHMPLAAVVAEICTICGISNFDVSGLYGIVRGYYMASAETGRQMLQALSECYGFDMVERNGSLVFISRRPTSIHQIDRNRLVATTPDAPVIEQTRLAPTEVPGRLQLVFAQADGDFIPVAEEIVVPFGDANQVARTELPLVLTRSEARETLEHWLSDLRAGRDTLSCAIPPSMADLNVGDHFAFSDTPDQVFRISQLERGPYLNITAHRVNPEAYQSAPPIQDRVDLTPHVPPLPVQTVFLDIPRLTSLDTIGAPYVVIGGDPWPGSVAVSSNDMDSNPEQNLLVTQRGILGKTKSILTHHTSAYPDVGQGIEVEILSGSLQSVSQSALENGANFAAIGVPQTQHWEVIQFKWAELIAPNRYRLSHILRGQKGTDAFMPQLWSENSTFVYLGRDTVQIPLAQEQRDQMRQYHIGPAGRSLLDPAYRQIDYAHQAQGARPMAPCHLACVIGNQSVTIKWTRRGRLDADRWDAQDIPLEYSSEKYRIMLTHVGGAFFDMVVEQPEVSIDRTEWDAWLGALPSDEIVIKVAQRDPQQGDGYFADLSIG